MLIRVFGMCLCKFGVNFVKCHIGIFTVVADEY